MDVILIILGFAAISWYWLDTRRAHEITLGICRHICQHHGMTLLDETVALDKITLQRDPAGQMRFHRKYLFEFTDNVAVRHQGYITLFGTRLDAYSMGDGHIINSQ
jgi:hypothetical protein